MRDSDILFKAAINRITARISKKLINSAEELAEIAEDFPQKLKNEWTSFKNEVIEESERLEKKAKNTTSTDTTKTNKKKSSNEDLIQLKIDNLRSKVIEINKNIEEIN